MNHPIFFDNKNSLNLFGLQKYFGFISTLYLKQKLPKVLMLTGNKGIGKSTLVNHFLYSIFDTKNYNLNKSTFSKDSTFLKQFRNNIFPNIIYISGAEFKTIKIDDIRILKRKILQSSISNKDRFIIFDDIELFNQNSLNALLKIIEEPSKKNYFILNNNNSKPLLNTVKSRALEIKIILKESQRLEIIEELVSLFKLKLVLNPKSSRLTPGNFIKFNHICNEFSIIPNDNFLNNLSLLLNQYKKTKDMIFLNVIFFVVDCYIRNLKDRRIFENDKIFEIRNHIFDNLNNFIHYNLNQNSFINALNEKLSYD